MNILGISGSPIKDSNTDGLVKTILESTELDYEFIKLNDYDLSPCNACLGCVKTNKCVLEDDGNLLCQKVKEADAVVIGGFTPYSTLDSRTKTFLERLYPLRHQHGYLKGKLGVGAITSCVTEVHELLPPAAQMGMNTIQFFMMEEGMNFLGGVSMHGNVPCIRCGKSDECAMSGVKMLYGDNETVKSVGIHNLESQEHVQKNAVALGKKIKETLLSN